ncbi:MAG TPA: glycosyltransferase family 9 protein [Ignavibacteriaceae bacterium]|nr:glycosyltransferase family 9 protein [Ignavibacteriaceae bacterium]
MIKIKSEKIKKILCIKPRGIGDIILSTIVLENLNSAFPHSEIHYLTEEFAKRSVENNPFVSRILTFNKKDFVLSIIRKVRKEKYDLVFDFWSNPKTAQITFLSGAKYRVGYEKRGRKYAYNFIGKAGTMGEHAAEDNLVLLNALNIPIISKRIIYQTTKEEKLFAEKFLNESNIQNEKLLIGIIPSGGWESKRCDPVKWIKICQEIQKKYQAQFLILWGPGDEKDATVISHGLLPPPLLTPKSSFGELSALIEKCDLIIANDSGPMHVSAALGKPTLGIFGPTDPIAHRPYSANSSYVIHSELHCIKCTKLVCPYNHECMLALPIEKVMTEVEKLMKLTGKF